MKEFKIVYARLVSDETVALSTSPSDYVLMELYDSNLFSTAENWLFSHGIHCVGFGKHDDGFMFFVDDEYLTLKSKL